MYKINHFILTQFHAKISGVQIWTRNGSKEAERGRKQNQETQRSSIEEVKYKPCPMKLQDQTIWRIWKGTGDHSGAAVDDSA